LQHAHHSSGICCPKHFNRLASCCQETAEAASENSDGKSAAETSNVIRQKSTVSQKGTTIKAVVNGQPITNYDVRRRAAFLKLRRVSGNRNQKALDELVEQSIKMQEARRTRSVASDAQVNDAYANFAKSNRMSSSQMTRVLGQAGVTAPHFKEFIRGQISWNRAVGSKFRTKTQQKTAADTMFEIRQSGGVKPETNEYVLEQTIFVIPSGKKKSLLKKRRAEALAFKKGFVACGQTASQAVGQRDVVVRSLPRSLEPQLPPEWKDELKKTPEGQTTAIKNTDKGVEFIAVCKKRVVSDDNAARIVSQSKEFDSFNEKGDEIAGEVLKEMNS